MWHEKEIRGGAYPYAGGWVAQPLDLLIRFDAMSLMYSYKMNEARLNKGDLSMESRTEIEKNTTGLQRDMAEWVESDE